MAFLSLLLLTIKLLGWCVLSLAAMCILEFVIELAIKAWSTE